MDYTYDPALVGDKETDANCVDIRQFVMDADTYAAALLIDSLNLTEKENN